MGSFLSALLSFGSGGAFGVIGGLIQKSIDAWKAKKDRELELEELKLNNAHEIAMSAENRETLKLEAEGKLAVARVEGDTAKTVADSNAMASALASDKRSYSTDAAADKYPLMLVLVDAARGFIRPFLTVYLNAAAAVIVAVSTYILFDAVQHNAMSIGDLKDMALATVGVAVKTILFLAEAATLFWFVTRPPQEKRSQ